MNWQQQAEERKSELLADLTALIKINSVLDETTATEEVPFGNGPLEALNWVLAQGQAQGMKVENMANKVGYIEMGEGDEMVGILCHVDVVPAGSDWVHEPFGAEIEDGKLFGRGAIDDKGPTMAAWLAMKMVKDAGIKLDRRVRMIIGSDEETGFRCVEHYFANEEMPTLGFAPDADFPIINAEKGIATFEFIQKPTTAKNEQLVQFSAGHRTNMVPDFAEAVLVDVPESTEMIFQAFIANAQLQGSYKVEGERVVISIKGKSAHAMEPNNGVNAAVKLAQFLNVILTTDHAKEFVNFVVTGFANESRGHALQLNFNDEISGDTTLNAGVVSYTPEAGGKIEVSVRYSVTYPYDEKVAAVEAVLPTLGFSLEITENSTPHHVDANSELIQKLSAVYERNTGEPVELLAIGGGTYARELENGVAFGMLFPGEPDIAHQADEFVVIENLIKAAAIYADAIVELGQK